MMPSQATHASSLPDHRVSHESALVNGHNIKFLYGVPENGSWRSTIFLIHGFPDLSLGWRYQIPFLVDLGFRVIAPDVLGYGGSDAPKVPSESIALYGMKHVSYTFAQLAKQLNATKIILGGHDWGGALVYRFAKWHPELVAAIFSICTPYTPPSRRLISLSEVVKRVPQFGYQSHLASGDIERNIVSAERIRQFLNGMYGAVNAQGKSCFNPWKGINFNALERMGKTSLLSDPEMDYYVQEYTRHGLHGPCNWYKTREVNFSDETAITDKRINVPVLFIAGLNDVVLHPSQSAGMEDLIPNLTRGEVKTGHWALWEDPDGVNELIRDWLTNLMPIASKI